MIVVTGASRGLGRAVAERFAAAGHEVVGVARTSADASFELRCCDVADDVAVRALARDLRATGRPVTGLVAAAGIASMNLALMTPLGTARRIVDVNLVGTVACCHALAPLLIRAGGGRIVTFSSIAVTVAPPGEAVYAASKAAVETYSRVLARELAGHGIAVACVAPGPIDTDLLRGVTDAQVDRLVERQVLPRRCTPDDVADVVELLFDPRAATLTGQVLHVGGV